MHTVIPPLPLDYLKREGHPDLLLVNGTEQKNFMSKIDGKKNEVKPIVSLRYKKRMHHLILIKIFFYLIF